VKTSARVLAGAGVTTVVLALGTAAGIGIASADPSPSPSPPGTTASCAHHKQQKTRKFLQHTAHGQFTLAGHKHRVVEVQRGTVSAVSSTSIKITSKDGFAASYVINSRTVVRERTRHEKPTESSASAIKTGDQVRLIGTQSGKTNTANRIVFTG
jgi:hypothetical protein